MLQKLILALLLMGMSLQVSVAETSGARNNKPLLPANFESSIKDHFVLCRYIWDEDRNNDSVIINMVELPIEGKLAAGKNELRLVIDTRVVIPFDEKYEGMTVLLVNNTEVPQRIPTQDYRLYMTQEALDRDGEWKPIESFQMATCGNSYFNVRLNPMTYWTFTAPRYQGAIKTKLRFRLALGDERTIYSREFKGSVNEGQFEGGRTGSPDFLKSLGIGNGGTRSLSASPN